MLIAKVVLLQLQVSGTRGITQQWKILISMGLLTTFTRRTYLKCKFKVVIIWKACVYIVREHSVGIISQYSELKVLILSFTVWQMDI